jgi:hypothetical protein
LICAYIGIIGANIVGTNELHFRAFRRSVLVWCTDYGVESGLATIPDVNIDAAWIQKQILREAPELLEFDSSVCADADAGSSSIAEEGHVNAAVVAPEDADVAFDPLAEAVDIALVAQSGVAFFFPNAFFIPGPKHQMHNLSQDVMQARGTQRGR